MITIPKGVADAMSVRDGTEMDIVQDSSLLSDTLTYKIKTKKKRPFSDFAGIFKGGKNVTNEEVMKWIKEGGYERLNLP